MQPLVECVEDGDPDAVGGDGVAVVRGGVRSDRGGGAGAVAAHLVAGVVRAEESGDVPAKASVGEAGDGVDDEAERAGQDDGASIPAAVSTTNRWHPLPERL